jgi:hypothetical protein
VIGNMNDDDDDEDEQEYIKENNKVLFLENRL